MHGALVRRDPGPDKALESMAMKLVPTLGFDDADALMRAALDAARARGISVTVAIVDRAGQMLALARMDGARADIRSASPSARRGPPLRPAIRQ